MKPEGNLLYDQILKLQAQGKGCGNSSSKKHKRGKQSRSPKNGATKILNDFGKTFHVGCILVIAFYFV